MTRNSTPSSARRTISIWQLLGFSLFLHAAVLWQTRAPQSKATSQLLEIDLRDAPRAAKIPAPSRVPNLKIQVPKPQPRIVAAPKTRPQVLAARPLVRPPVQTQIINPPLPPAPTPNAAIAPIPIVTPLASPLPQNTTAPDPQSTPAPIEPQPTAQPSSANLQPTSAPQPEPTRLTQNPTGETGQPSGGNSPAPGGASGSSGAAGSDGKAMPRSSETADSASKETTDEPLAKTGEASAQSGETSKDAGASSSNNSSDGADNSNRDGEIGKGRGQNAGDKIGSGSGEKTGDGNGSGNGKNAGSGDGEGNGLGDGKGDGNGKGSGDGEGNGEGKGRGDGKGNGDGNGGKGGGSGPFGIQAGGAGPRHIVYVLDISNSMEFRITRAKDELRQALSTLQPNESFNVVAFYAGSMRFQKNLVLATPENIARGRNWIDALQLRGGTNLESALRQALKSQRANTLVVITDGVPTRGETDFERLGRLFRKLNVQRARCFTIGLVGKDPEGKDQTFEATRLLQQLSNGSGGTFTLYPLG